MDSHRKPVNSDLIDKLIRSLHRLKFSDIRTSYYSEYPDPEIDLPKMEESDYVPSLVAKKNDVFYCFELISDSLSGPSDTVNLIRHLRSNSHKRWDIDHVLVTEYGNRDRIREWCRSNNLSVSLIWEL